MVINLLRTHVKLHCEKEPYWSAVTEIIRYTNTQTNTQPVTLLYMDKLSDFFYTFLQKSFITSVFTRMVFQTNNDYNIHKSKAKNIYITFTNRFEILL